MFEFGLSITVNHEDGFMHLEEFSKGLRERLSGSLFKVSEAKRVDARAKEYLHRLRK